MRRQMLPVCNFIQKSSSKISGNYCIVRALTKCLSPQKMQVEPHHRIGGSFGHQPYRQLWKHKQCPNQVQLDSSKATKTMGFVLSSRHSHRFGIFCTLEKNPANKFPKGICGDCIHYLTELINKLCKNGPIMWGGRAFLFVL